MKPAITQKVFARNDQILSISYVPRASDYFLKGMGHWHSCLFTHKELVNWQAISELSLSLFRYSDILGCLICEWNKSRQSHKAQNRWNHLSLYRLDCVEFGTRKYKVLDSCRLSTGKSLPTFCRNVHIKQTEISSNQKMI